MAKKDAALSLKPLDDRVVVEPTEAEEKTAGGILLPDTAKQKPQQGKVIAVGPGKLTDEGNRIAGRREDRRHRPVRQVLGLGRRGERQGVQDPPRERHPREAQQVDTNTSTELSIMAKQLLYTDDARKKLLAGAEKLAHAVGHHARADRAERHHRQVVRRAHRHEGRRDGLQGDRPARPVREHGREARQRGRPEDARRRRRRHHHRDRARAGDLPGRAADRQFGANPMSVKRGIDKAVAKAVEHLEEKLTQEADQEGGDAERRQHLREQRPEDRRADGRRVREGRQGRRHHGRGGQDLRDAARLRRGDAVRQGLHLAVFRGQHAGTEVGAGERHHSPHGEEARQRPRDAAAARSGRQGRQAAPHHRRGRRERGAGGAGRQPARRASSRCAP